MSRRHERQENRRAHERGGNSKYMPDVDGNDVDSSSDRNKVQSPSSAEKIQADIRRLRSNVEALLRRQAAGKLRKPSDKRRLQNERQQLEQLLRLVLPEVLSTPDQGPATGVESNDMVEEMMEPEAPPEKQTVSIGSSASIADVRLQFYLQCWQEEEDVAWHDFCARLHARGGKYETLAGGLRDQQNDSLPLEGLCSLLSVQITDFAEWSDFPYSIVMENEQSRGVED